MHWLTGRGRVVSDELFRKREQKLEKKQKLFK